ncbi:MAG: rod-binding protein [Pseudomonadota bacterium]
MDIVSFQAQAAAQSASQSQLRPDLANTAVEFEAVFLAQMLNQMFDQLPTDGPFGGGQGEAMFRSQLADQYGGIIAQNGGVGIADSLQSEFLRLQEQAQ